MVGFDRTPNAYVAGAVELPEKQVELIEKRNSVLSPTYRLLYQRPLHFVRGEGVYLYTEDNEKYLDFYNNVASLGHCHPRVCEATARQLNTLATNTRYLHEGILETSQQLLSHFPQELDRVVYACTGSEANDLAMRFASLNTGGEGVIVSTYAYHGTTSLIAGMSPNLGLKVPLSPGVRRVPPPRLDDPHAVETFTADVEHAMNDLERHGIKIAAFMFDSLFTSDGVFPDPEGFLKPAVDAVRRRGGLVISDEVQPGFGRTGSHYWGFERHGITPDFVTLGKPMGNGYPVSALVARSALLEEVGGDLRYFNTFGGNTVAVAAAKAVMDVIEDDELQQNAADVGSYFADGMRELARSSSVLGEVRAAGLYLGVDVHDASTGEPSKEETTRIVNALRNDKILISICGPHENTLKIRPPLVITKSHVDQFIETLSTHVHAS